MCKCTIIWLVIAGCLIVAGLVLFTVTMVANGWDFTKLDTAQYETSSHTVQEAFTDISIQADTADIQFVRSDDGNCRVVCYERTSEKHSVTVENSTLTIEVHDERKWYEYIGIHFDRPTITVYLPQDLYETVTIDSDTGDVQIPADFSFMRMDIAVSTGDVKTLANVLGNMKITTSTGHISAENLTAGSMELKASTGDISLSSIICHGDMTIRLSTGKVNLQSVRCNNFLSTGSTGNITLTNLVASGTLSIQRSTGDVRFNGCDAAEITVCTDTGKVTGTLLSEKIFFAETDTGKVDVPKTMTGGKCQITTDTGNIILKIAKE